MSNEIELLKLQWLARRCFLRTAGAGALALAAGPALLPRLSRPARAESGTIRMLGVTTVALPDWSQFEADTGLKMEFTPIDDNPGLWLHEVKANDAGDRYDILAQLSGIYKFVSDEGYIMPVDLGQMPNAAGASQGRDGEPADADQGRRDVGRAADLQCRHLRLLPRDSRRAPATRAGLMGSDLRQPKDLGGASDSTTASLPSACAPGI